jgi:phosphatidylglycerophosphatase C
VKVCLVDFDGTLTEQDTNRVLILSLLKLRPWLLPFVFWDLVILKSGLLSAELVQTVKNRCVARLLSGLGLTQSEKCFSSYAAQCRNMFRPLVADAIKTHVDAGVQVLVVTASMQEAVAKALEDLPVEVIGARFPMASERFTGGSPIQTCYGETKVQAVQRWAATQSVALVFVEAWSDSLSDLPMMRLAQRRFWVCKAADQSAFLAADPEGELVVVG